MAGAVLVMSISLCVANFDAVKTITVQVVWEDGSGSEIVTYRPCDNVGEGTCARIKKISKPTNKLSAPTPEAQSR